MRRTWVITTLLVVAAGCRTAAPIGPSPGTADGTAPATRPAVATTSISVPHGCTPDPDGTGYTCVAPNP